MNNEAKLGRTLSHANGVIVKSPIFSSDQKYRYSLEIEFGNSSGNDLAVIILKNPSSATGERADTTIRRIEDYFLKNLPEVRSLIVVNLFAIRSTYTDYLEMNRDLMDLVGPENDNYISKYCSRANKVICAWGGNSGINNGYYEARIKQVLTLVQANTLYQVVGKRKTAQPLHGMMWGMNHSLEKFSSHKLFLLR